MKAVPKRAVTALRTLNTKEFNKLLNWMQDNDGLDEVIEDLSAAYHADGVRRLKTIGQLEQEFKEGKVDIQVIKPTKVISKKSLAKDSAHAKSIVDDVKALLERRLCEESLDYIWTRNCVLAGVVAVVNEISS